MTAYLRIKEIETGNVIKSVKLTGPLCERRVDRIMSGLLRNMDTDRFFVDDSEVDAAIGAEGVDNGGLST
jgi:hypothetical protein